MLKIPRSVIHRRLIPLNRVVSCSRKGCSSQASSGSQAPKDGAPPPPPPPPSKGMGFFGKFAGFTVVVSGGALAVAYYKADIEEKDSYMDKTQKTINELKRQIALLTDLKKYLPGQSSEKPASMPKVPKPDTDVMKSLLPDKTKKVEPTPVAEAPSQKSKEKVKPSEPVKKEMTAKEKKEQEEQNRKAAEEKKKEEENKRLERARQAKEEEERAENRALESILTDLVRESGVSVELAIQAQKHAAQTTRDHIVQLKKAMDGTEQTDGQWEEVTKTQDKRAEASNSADRLTQNARMHLEKLKVIVDEGKESAITQKNPQIKKAEETMKQIKYDLEEAAAELSKAQSEVRVVKEYQDLVKKGKEQFKKELESLTPEVRIRQGWGGSMSVEDLNSLIAHAHRRIDQLQRQLAEQQAMEAQRIEVALASQKAEDDKLASSRVDREKEKMKSEFNIERGEWEIRAQLKTEEEIRQQLARQAAAHSDHLAQVLKVQRHELESHFQVLLQDRLMQERATFSAEVAGHIYRLRGIETAVEARADMEKQGRRAQELWLACQTLATMIQEGREEGATWEEKLKPLKHEVEAIKEAGGSHPMVSVVLDSIPQESINRGVWTEISLMERFQKVRRVCRRVAMVDETRNTLFRYFVSYLQSFFVFSQGKPLTESDEIDPDKLTTFVILDNAKWCLDRGDLEQALRFMNQLTGESRRVASDWIQEARLLLETKQASDALLAYASASGLGALY